MNEIQLHGVIRDITPSHIIGNTQYYKASLVARRSSGAEDILSLSFKEQSLRYSDGDEIDLSGNLRSHSTKLSDGKNKIDIYVFTYFDSPSAVVESADALNKVHIDGRVCKINEVKGHEGVHFILANNILCGDKKLNSYIPCVAYGSVAEKLSTISVNDCLEVVGELHSRVYRKYINPTDYELSVAHELSIDEVL